MSEKTGLKTKKEEVLFFTEYQILDRIRIAYQQPAYTVLASLRDGTGFMTRGQSCDAVAFGTWPSRGLKIIGFEIKSYRGDWLRELKNPAKAETFALYCDEWWIVGAEDVVKLEEVPDVWGWATPTQKGLKRMKEPRSITAKEIDKVFLMSIMRNIGNNYTPTKDVKEQIEKATTEEITRRRDSALIDLKFARDQVSELRKQITDFEKAAGFELSSWKWQPDQIGALVKEIVDGNVMWNLQQVESAGRGIEKVLADIRAIPFFREKSA